MLGPLLEAENLFQSVHNETDGALQSDFRFIGSDSIVPWTLSVPLGPSLRSFDILR
jgi:hypothetical protein